MDKPNGDKAPPSYSDIVRASFLVTGSVHPSVFLREIASRLRGTEQSTDAALPDIIDAVLDEANVIVKAAVEEIESNRPRIVKPN